MGSDSDLSTMQATFQCLEAFGIDFEARILSAHRTPERTRQYVREAEGRGCAVFVAAAGLAAHLAGAIAALTVKPVIGVPMDAGSLGGLDALLSTVQMPGGVPVATVAIGRAGARNAAYLAAQMIALNDPEIAVRLRAERSEQADQIARKDAALADDAAAPEGVGSR